MRTTSRLAVLALAAGLAACSDNTMAPKTEVARPQSVHGGGVTAALTQTDTFRFSVTINPWTRTYWDLGAGNSIVFPAHSLCDVYRSSYGMGEWDKPCTPATNSQTIQVKAWLDGAGHPRVDFYPNVRFVPSNDPYNWVVLSFADYSASLNPFFNINYCPVVTSNACIDESRSDPSVATVHDPITGKVTRRLKHFSGYNVAAGDQSMMNRTPTGQLMAPQGPQRSVVPGDSHGDSPFSEGEMLYQQMVKEHKRSGYMLASG
jgi:hypothetical protein